MKIHNLSLELDENDIEPIIKKVLSKDKLSINSISIDRFLIVDGNLLIKSFKLPFICKLSFLSHSSHSLLIKIHSFSTANIPIPNKIKDTALTLLKNIISSENISITNNLIKADIKNILNDFLPIDFTIDSCDINDTNIYISLSDIASYYSLEQIISSVV